VPGEAIAKALGPITGAPLLALALTGGRAADTGAPTASRTGEGDGGAFGGRAGVFWLGFAASVTCAHVGGLCLPARANRPLAADGSPAEILDAASSAAAAEIAPTPADVELGTGAWKAEETVETGTVSK